jgi:hypothetical protein
VEREENDARMGMGGREEKRRGEGKKGRELMCHVGVYGMEKTDVSGGYGVG